MVLRYRRFLLLAGASALAVTVFVAFPRFLHFRAVREAERLLERELPPEEIPNPNPNTSSPINLPVPFTPQAPHGNWDLPYREACEEAAALMAIRYAFGTPFLSMEDADAGIRELVRINEEVLGYPVDQTAEQVRRLIAAADNRLQARLLRNPTVQDLQRELRAGNAVIVPAAGRMLRNPFFRRPGPRYHMLVLRGFTEDGYFITNDPGTKRGEGYLYPFARIMEVMHDWNGGEVETGEKVVIVVEPLKEIDNGGL